MEVGRFFYCDDSFDNVFYYKDIYLIDEKRNMKTAIQKYPIKLIITDDEIKIVHNRINIKVLAKNEIVNNDNDKFKLNITPRQFTAFSIPFNEEKIKTANKQILKMYNINTLNLSNHFELVFSSKDHDTFVDSSNFYKEEISDEGYGYFHNYERKVEHTFKNLKSFGVKKMYKRKKPIIKNHEIRLIIPFKRILLEFLYDYHFMNVFQDSLPKQKVKGLDLFFNKSIVIKGISLKFKLVYLKSLLKTINKSNNHKKSYGSSQYKKILKSWRKLILSPSFEEINHKYYRKNEWFNDSENEIIRVHKDFLPLLKNLKENG